MAPIRLSLDTLESLPAAVARPGYERSDLSAGIVHFGVGNFHRAHQAEYLDRLFSSGESRDWALIGAGVFEGERKGRDVLAEQDWLTTLVEQEADRSEARVLGSMIDYVEPANAEAIIACLACADIRIVSLTITEGGYFLDSQDRFDPGHPAILADAEMPDGPKTVFGMILAGLRARRSAGLDPFTVMSCDNIPHNGVVTRNALTGLAALSDPGFAAWIGENVAFPNGMVDRITPATTDREREILRNDFGVEDSWPVFCEGFTQWVLEDNFPLGRPAFEKVGVQFVEDVSPFELMKLRVLNGGHATIAYPAGLLGIHYVHEAMEHPVIRAFLRKLTETEVIPTVPPVPDTDVRAYFDLIESRFSNPKIGDTVRRLCLDGSNRQPKFIVPVLRDALASGGSVEGLALESALWCRYCAGEDEAGAIIAPNDPNWDALVPVARAARECPEVWLTQENIYGAVGRDPTFIAAFGRWLGMLWSEGTVATLESYLAES
ncbi:mannitol dehydrogenase family protein [Maritimibacter sp. UBA3975]|uniref:mannitol dehydrogenase family protein n=1 Tax=Maritimibacter sp. UBA3975 TaxID=1946833 RepID=UPI000C093D6C|nr:mannitol dehydrogenase family protein [Maritimibacter sp. UBA3975]MAM63382.1 mannitol dehydrogenase [Maritimibacter sp.]|tara:strand:- start:98187 stop:99662 length:1476 start_codon:yes stop_codon:yes gene_type:complete